MMAMIWIYCASGALATVGAIFLIRRSRRSDPVWPKDTVVLHQFTRGSWAPSLSPYPMKLETYLRMAKIPYVNDFSGKQSAKGKTPSITYNKDNVADSQFSIEYLNKKLDTDLNQHLSPEQKAVAKAFQRLVEDNLYWCLVLWRWIYTTDDVRKMMHNFISTFTKLPVKSLLLKIGRSMVWKQAYGHGMARHAQNEVQQISEENLKALSVFIGSKKYMMGDAPSEVDCTVFGMLAQIVWQLPGTAAEQVVNDKYPNLRDYCYRMKDEYWPDWDDCISHGFTREAPK